MTSLHTKAFWGLLTEAWAKERALLAWQGISNIIMKKKNIQKPVYVKSNICTHLKILIYIFKQLYTYSNTCIHIQTPLYTFKYLCIQTVTPCCNSGTFPSDIRPLCHNGRCESSPAHNERGHLQNTALSILSVSSWVSFLLCFITWLPFCKFCWHENWRKF